jgi:hypothetical protein
MLTFLAPTAHCSSVLSTGRMGTCGITLPYHPAVEKICGSLFSFYYKTGCVDA